MTEPVHPAIMRVVRRLQEVATNEDPFCCESEAGEFAESLIRDLKDAGIVDEKWSNAKAWINSFSVDHGMNYRELMDSAEAYLDWDEKSTDDYFDINYTAFIAKLPEFWDNYEIVTGTTVPPEKRTESFFAHKDEN